MDYSTKQKNIAFKDLIETFIILEFESTDGRVYEANRMFFKKDITINEMIKQIITNYNEEFEALNKNIYLIPEGIGYNLCECEDFEIKPGTFKTTNVQFLNSDCPLVDIKNKTFRLFFDPKDILLNYNPKSDKGKCSGCTIV